MGRPERITTKFRPVPLDNFAPCGQRNDAADSFSILSIALQREEMGSSSIRSFSRFCKSLGPPEKNLMVGLPLFLTIQQHSRPYIRYHITPKGLTRHSVNSHHLRFPLHHSFSSSAPSSHSKIGFIAWYLGKLEAHPLITKALSSSLIYAAADITSQVNPRVIFLLFDSVPSYFHGSHESMIRPKIF